MKKPAKKLTKSQIAKLRKAVGQDEKAPLLQIRQKEGAASKCMTGANTELLLDGQLVRGATGVRFEVNAKGIATATITLIGRFEVVGRPVTKTLKLYK